MHTFTQVAYPAPNTLFIQPGLKGHQGNMGTRKLFMVCKGCNTGWMRNCQDKTIPILKPLIRGEWHDLSPDEGAQIAYWASMTATVIAMSYKNSLGVTPETRKEIMTSKAASGDWRIWLGKGSGFQDVTYANRVFSFGRKSDFGPSGPRPNTTITTIALRQLLIHAINIPEGKVAFDAISYGRELGIFPIHPWGGEGLPQAWIPVIHSGSREYRDLVDGLANVWLARSVSTAYDVLHR